MRRIVAGMMLILLTACSDSDPAPASAPADTVSLPVPAITQTAEMDIDLPTSPGDKPASKADKQQAQALAADLLRVMLTLEGVVDDSSIMDDTARYGRYFSSAIDAPLVRWQKMADAGHSDLFGNMGYCREAGQALASLGQMVHAKGFAQQFIDERRGQFTDALPKCQLAIKARS